MTPSFLQVLTKQEPHDISDDDIVEVDTLDSGVETTPLSKARRNLMRIFEESAGEESTSHIEVQELTEKPEKSNESHENEDVPVTEKPKQSNDNHKDVPGVMRMRQQTVHGNSNSACAQCSDAATQTISRHKLPASGRRSDG